jgi:anti-sigma B factor antagonist
MDLLTTAFVQGDPPVLQLAGEIDISTADQLRAALVEALSTNPKAVIDMADVTFFDAAGIRVVLQAAANQDGAGPLTLIASARVLRVLEVVGLSELPSIAISVGDTVHER